MPTASGDGTTFGFENPVYDGVTTDGDDYLAVDAAPETKRGKGGALSHGNHGTLFFSPPFFIWLSHPLHMCWSRTPLIIT